MNSSKRTISYIGFWALIMPWLGFNWETKTVLFSLTGIVLLIVGNRQYHNEKKRQKINHTSSFVIEEKIEQKSEQQFQDLRIENIPIQNVSTSLEENQFTSFTPDVIIQKNIIRKKVEMAPRVKRITVQKSNVETLSDFF
jgi:hypothetical protein